MAELIWDKPGDRVYHTGLDKGVFYPKRGEGVPWNGLVSVAPKATTTQVEEIFYLGRKVYDSPAPSFFSATMDAYTYPDAAETYLGVEEDDVGFMYMNQAPKYFDMSYRSIVGNDTKGEEYGYQIHLLYDLMATPKPISNSTLMDRPTAELFSWDLTSRTNVMTRPSLTAARFPIVATGHVILDSRKLPEDIMKSIENALYGDCWVDPHIPSLQELHDNFGAGVYRKGEAPIV